MLRSEVMKDELLYSANRFLKTLSQTNTWCRTTWSFIAALWLASIFLKKFFPIVIFENVENYSL